MQLYCLNTLLKVLIKCLFKVGAVGFSAALAKMGLLLRLHNYDCRPYPIDMVCLTVAFT